MKNLKAKKNRKAYIYLTPALISITVLSILPMLYTIFIAFTNYSLKNQNYGYGTAAGWKIVGLYQFQQILTGALKSQFFPLLLWTLIFTAISTFGCYFIGLIFAMCLSDKNMKESFIYKGLLVIPWALPGAITIVSFRGLFNSQYGLINLMLQQLHLIKEPIMWLTTPFAARLAVILINLWIGFPYMMNVCMGAISAIPDTHYEAADLDGATGFQKFTKITLPSLAKTSYPLLISNFAFNFNNFNSAYLLTDGGPSKAGSSFAGWTDILGSATYKMSTLQGNFALGAAMSILLFLIIGTLSIINMNISGQFKESEG
ncbi:carbohydrate ABC transporter permease [Clostridium sp. YIM B02551]|uniref:carbohydrate ABC transporter permease n=1 Tax=Clostridium sp. YIM B02551 TaxID=2910679 RepID=UPI001EEC2EAB|nr:sugar ABC transporter permease [Clostridium sp. YIM B02551]